MLSWTKGFGGSWPAGGRWVLAQSPGRSAPFWAISAGNSRVLQHPVCWDDPHWETFVMYICHLFHLWVGPRPSSSPQSSPTPPAVWAATLCFQSFPEGWHHRGGQKAGAPTCPSFASVFMDSFSFQLSRLKVRIPLGHVLEKLSSRLHWREAGVRFQMADRDGT